MQIQQALQNVGLTDKESAIYIACLKHGPETVAALARLSGVKRSTIIYLAQHLVDLGLVIPIRQGKRTLFEAEKPDQILALLQKREQALKQVLPDLNSLRKEEGELPSVSVHEGYRQIKKVYEDVYSRLRQGEAIWFLTSTQDLHLYAPFVLDEYLKAVQETIPAHVRELVLADSHGQAYAQKIQRAGLKHPIRLLPTDFPIHNDMVLLPDRVILLSFKKQVSAVIIENKDITETMRTLYEWAWSNATTAD